MKILKILKKIWVDLQESYPKDEEETFTFENKNPKRRNSWCPFCGYSGTSEDVRIHLLNCHRK